ncbi:MAG: hypothetical protein ACOYB4_06605 [Methyloceanibacter sp.]
MTMRMPALLLLAAAFLMGVTQGLARTGESLVWTDRSSGGLVALAYGSLDPMKNPLFLLSCFNDMNIAVLDVHQAIAGAKPGEPLTIELAAGATKSPVEGETARDETNEIVFGEASGFALEPILAVLRETGPVTVTMGAASATLSDNGRAEAVAQFAKDCQVQ